MPDEKPTLLPRQPKHHAKKCWPEPFQAVLDERKTYEIREWDDYVEGDTYQNLEWNPETKEFTGRETEVFTIGKVIKGAWGLPESLCVFSLLRRPLPAPDRGGTPETDALLGTKYDDARLGPQEVSALIALARSLERRLRTPSSPTPPSALPGEVREAMECYLLDPGDRPHVENSCELAERHGRALASHLRSVPVRQGGVEP